MTGGRSGGKAKRGASASALEIRPAEVECLFDDAVEGTGARLLRSSHNARNRRITSAARSTCTYRLLPISAIVCAGAAEPTVSATRRAWVPAAIKG